VAYGRQYKGEKVRRTLHYQDIRRIKPELCTQLNKSSLCYQMKVIPAVRNYSPHISQTGFILESIFALGLNIISLLQEKIYMDEVPLVFGLSSTPNPKCFRANATF
jgi:hypothetical protein